jgi:hypothetical protein
MRPDKVKRRSPWAGPAPLCVIEGNDPDQFVDAVFDNVDQEQIANELLQKAQTGDRQVAAALFQLLYDVPGSVLGTEDRVDTGDACCTLNH